MNANQIEIRKKALDPSGAVASAWTGFKGNYWTLLLAIIISGILQLIISLLPFAGVFILPFIAGPLAAGLSKMMLDVVDGEFVSVGSVFDGFQKFLPNAIVALIVAIPGLSLVMLQLAFIVPEIAGIFTGEIGSGQIPAEPIAYSMRAFGIIVVLASYVLSIASVFSHYLIMDRGLEAVDAIKVSGRGVLANFGRLFVLGLIVTVLFIGGFLALVIGMLFVYPVILLSVAFAYREIFPKTTGLPQSYEPPDPDQYNGMFGQIT